MEESSSPVQGSTEWTAESHSWILVPTETGASDVAAEAAAVPDSPLVQPPGLSWPVTTESATSLGAAPDTAPIELPPPASESTTHDDDAAMGSTSLHTPAQSPKTLSESLLQEGETVAEMLVSEILSPSSPIVSRSGSHASDVSQPNPPSLWGESSGPLKPAAPGSACMLCGQVGAQKASAPMKGEEANREEIFPLAALWPTASPLWSRPLAIVAVLVATHAATLLLGVVLGRQHAAEPKTEECLARRFSSGPYGNHARLSWS